MKQIPKKIYLQVDAGGEQPEVFNPIKEKYSWCSDKIHGTDLAFYSSEVVEKLMYALQEIIDEDDLNGPGISSNNYHRATKAIVFAKYDHIK